MRTVRDAEGRHGKEFHVTTSKIRLNDIHIYPSLQPRVEGINPAHVAVLQQVPESWPPIAVIPHEGRYLLVDGFHRYAAAQNLGLTAITAEVLSIPEDGDVHTLAFALNAVHGRPLSLDDRRAFAARLLAHQPQTSNMEVSRRSGLSPTTIATIRERLEATEQIEAVPERIGSNGNRYPTPEPERAAGELPSIGIGASVGQALGRLISPGKRAQQRKLAKYLQRLAVALDDQDELDGWSSADEAAEACRLVLGDDVATALGERLGRASGNVLNVALVLGYDEDAP